MITIEELADRLVGHLYDLTAKQISYLAVKPADVATVQTETAAWTLFLFPYAEREEPFDRGDACRFEYDLNVVINGPIAGQLTRAKGLELVRFLKDALHELELDGFRWEGTETVSLYDADAQKTKKQFLHLFRPTFFNFE